MKKEHRNLTKEFKLKVILEALQEQSSMKEIAQKYEIHPNQVTTRKREFWTKPRR
jgi:transposase